MSEGSNLPLCLDCGACCHSINPSLVELLGGDLRDVPSAFVESSRGGFQMKMRPDVSMDDTARGGHGWVCAALGEKNACSIYERRPFLCREFERGSPECHVAIADLGKPFKDRRH